MVALEADIARKVEIMLLVMNRLVQFAAWCDLVLSGEVESKDSFFVDLHQDREATMVTHFLTEGQSRASHREEPDFVDLVVLAVVDSISDRLQSCI